MIIHDCVTVLNHFITFLKTHSNFFLGLLLFTNWTWWHRKIMQIAKNSRVWARIKGFNLKKSVYKNRSSSTDFSSSNNSLSISPISSSEIKFIIFSLKIFFTIFSNFDFFEIFVNFSKLHNFSFSLRKFLIFPLFWIFQFFSSFFWNATPRESVSLRNKTPNINIRFHSFFK